MGIECGSQITLCELPIRFDTYKGCSHGCRYCFVQRKHDISKVEKDNCIVALRNFIKGKRAQETSWCDWDIPLHWGGVSDPFQPCEKVHKISFEALKVFAETKYPFIVSTKGKLICDDEYINLLKQCNAVVQVSMVCSKYDVLEKGAPTYDERLEMVEKLSKIAKRVIVRIQPYMTEVHKDILENLKHIKKAGAFGITIEGMKFAKSKKGLVRVGADFCYDVDLLKQKYLEIREECHNIGLAFYCAENRLREIGDDFCCCGINGLEGFYGNKNNLLRKLKGLNIEKRECQTCDGTGRVFLNCFQDSKTWHELKGKSYEEAQDYFLKRKGEKLVQEFNIKK